jgi:hypothetical protein
VKSDRALGYYREREWRIACNFTVNGISALRVLTDTEKAQVLAIGPEFFGRQIKTDTGPVVTLDKALVLPGLSGKRVIELVKRVVVPSAARACATHILATLESPPPVVSIDTLRT